MSIILTCNAGSSNTKLAAFDRQTLERRAHTVTHDAAQTTEWMCSVGTLDISAVGHRVVHGGRHFAEPVALTPEVIDTLNACIPLAPLHLPPALRLITETRQLYPQAQLFACFDTGFHHSLPEVERRLPLPRRFHDQGIMRYGFHGLSYQHIVDVLPEEAGARADGRVVVAHLGNGSSACAMHQRQSVASTMGFSTLDGLMMGTRCGALDPGVVLHLLKQEQLSAEEVDTLLTDESGLCGVSGISGDVRELRRSEAPEAREALALYAYLAAKQIASLLPALGGMDALVFTGGIGEHDAGTREAITDWLRWVGEFAVYTIPTDEERVIARAGQDMFGD